MEFKVKQVQDTREKMQLRHIKGLDIVTNEVNRIMPNSLTEKNLRSSLYANDEDEEQKTNEQIKRDLEDVDDVFAANVWSAVKLGPDNVPAGEGEGSLRATEEEKEAPEEEWIESSSDGGKADEEMQNNPDFDLSQDLSIQKLRKDEEKIMKGFDDKGDPCQRVLVQQLLDMQIKQKKKEVRKNLNLNPPQSYRQNLVAQNNLADLMVDGENQNTDFKSHSLKNS